MKNLTIAIFAKMTSATALYTSIGGRLFKGQAPQDAEFPYIVYFLVSDIPEKNFSDAYENVLIQFSIFSAASGTTEIEDIYTNLKALYDECSLTITGSKLIWMRRQNAVLFVVDQEVITGGIRTCWHYAVDYEILTSLD